MMSSSALMALVSAVVILLIGFRVYLLDRSNYQYRGFGALCALIAWMCFCWYEMEQTTDLETAIYWRRMQSIWTLSNPLIVYCCWRFASMYLRSIASGLKVLFFLLIVIPAIFFFGLEIFTDLGHGKVTMLESGHWGLALNGINGLSIARFIWSILIYGSSIYFIHLVWKEETIRFRKRWLLVLLSLLCVGASFTLAQNYILPIQGIVLPINESLNTLISFSFFGWALSDFQVFDLKPESAFEHVVGSMSNLMIITKADFQIKKINPTAMTFFNTDERQARNVSLEKIIGIEAADKLIANADKGFKQEIAFDSGEKKAHILFSTSLIQNRRGRKIGYVFIGNDLTEYYRAMAEIRHYNTQLETSNQSLESFAYAVSHDLKEPLRTINGFVTLLDRRLANEDDPEIREYIAYVNKGIVRMNSLIDSILTISRLGNEQEEEEQVNLERVVLEVNEKLRAIRNLKNATIHYNKLPNIKGRYHQISLLFQNLIENGIKYNNDAKPQVNIAYENTSDGYQFAIQDNGIGIDPKYREQVFQMFKRLHSSADYEGTGIGLTMCQKIVEGLGGRIWIESPEQLCSGTIFKFLIPKKLII